MKLPIILTILLALVSASLTPAAAVPPEMLWAKVYGDTFGDYATSIVSSSDGGAIIAGGKWRGEPNDYDLMLMKVDAAGDSVWGFYYGGEGNQWAADVIATPDGGFITTGYDAINHMDQGMAAKFNSEGELLWWTTFGVAPTDFYYYYKALPAPDEGYYLVGDAILAVPEGGVMNTDCIVSRISAEGVIEWTNYYGEPLVNEFCYDAIATRDGGIALTGYTWLPREDDFNDALLMKIAPDGGLEWTQEYGAQDRIETGYALAQTPDDGFVIAGAETFGDPTQYLVRTNEMGELLWERFYGREEVFSYAWCIANRPDNGFLMGGWTSGQGNGNYDFHLMALDAQGDTIWSEAWGGFDAERCVDMLPTDDGGLMLVGETCTFGNGRTMCPDVWLIKVFEEPDGVRFEPADGYPSNLSLLPAYPNPFNSTTLITLQTPFAGAVQGKLVDGNGRIWSIWNTDYQAAGSGRFLIEGEQLPAGTYWVKVSQAGRSANTKVVLVR